MKRLLWTVLVSAVTAATAALAARLLERAWRRIVHEPPPEMPAWAHFFVGKPLKSRIELRTRARM
jgi:hypothetical protein